MHGSAVTLRKSYTNGWTPGVSPRQIGDIGDTAVVYLRLDVIKFI